MSARLVVSCYWVLTVIISTEYSVVAFANMCLLSLIIKVIQYPYAKETVLFAWLHIMLFETLTSAFLCLVIPKVPGWTAVITTKEIFTSSVL